MNLSWISKLQSLTYILISKVNRRRRLSVGLRLTIGFIILAIILWKIDLNAVTKTFSSIRLFPAVFLCFAVVVRSLLMAYKWNLLLRSRGIFISMWQATQLYYIGHLLGTITPAGIGGDAYRVTALSRFQKNQIVASTIVLERIIGFAVIIVFAVLGLPVTAQFIGPASKSVLLTTTVIVMFAIPLVFLSFFPSFIESILNRFPLFSKLNIVQKLRNFHYIYAESRRHPSILFGFILLTAMEFVVLVSLSYFAAKSLGINISFGYLLCIMPLVNILLRLPITFQGVGLQEGLFVYVFTLANFSAADGLSTSLLLRCVWVVLGLLPSLLMLWASPTRVKTSSV